MGFRGVRGNLWRALVLEAINAQWMARLHNDPYTRARFRLIGLRNALPRIHQSLDNIERAIELLKHGNLTTEQIRLMLGKPGLQLTRREVLRILRLMELLGMVRSQLIQNQGSRGRYLRWSLA